MNRLSPEYQKQIQQPIPGRTLTEFGTPSDILTGAGKGLGSTAFGLGTLAEKGISAITGIGRERLGIVPEEKPEFLKPKTTLEKVGFGAEQIAEFLLPSTGVAKVAKAIGTGGKALAGRALLEAGVTGGISTAQQGGVTDEVKRNAIIAAAFPVIGASLKGVSRLTGRTLEKAGEKIQFSKIRPSIREEGFDIKNVQKYDLGGDLAETLSKSADAMNQRTDKLRNILKSGENPVNLNEVYGETVNALTKGKAREFGGVSQIKGVLEQLKGEIIEQSDTGVVDLLSAHQIKQGAGTKGAWSHGFPDKDAPAIGRVYTTFYHKLKDKIENLGPEGIKQVNKEISDIIPIYNAAVKRLPVEQRNNMISLTDNMGLYASIFDPKALLLIGAQNLSKSGRFANILIKAGQALKKEPERGAIRERLFGGSFRVLNE